MTQRAVRLRSNDSGQALVEYILLIALVAIGLTGILIVFRNAIGGAVVAVEQTLKDAPNGCKNPMPGVQNPNCP
jgi:Flp pilus assembly pilin Flp